MSSVLWCIYLGMGLLDDTVTLHDFGKAAKPSSMVFFFFTFLSAVHERPSFSAALTKLAVLRFFIIAVLV